MGIKNNFKTNLQLLKIMYKINRSIAVMPFNYIKYKRLLCKCNIRLENCKMYFRTNNILFFNEEKKQVYRCSLNKFGYRDIIKNYNFLMNSKLNNIPEPITLWEKDNIAISAEKFMKGKKVNLQDINSKLILNILQKMSILYAESNILTDFNVNKALHAYDYLMLYYNPLCVEKLKELKKIIIQKNDTVKISKKRNVVNTIIHGDLTYRNMLLNNDQIILCDFCRSEISFPEFDIYLFFIDKITYSNTNKPINYITFFDNIIKYINDEIKIPELKIFYNINNKFKINKEMEKILRYLFLYRMAILTLQNFKIRDSSQIKILDNIIERLKNCYEIS
jgi:thiamine kinase-like enzyme